MGRTLLVTALGVLVACGTGATQPPPIDRADAAPPSIGIDASIVPYGEACVAHGAGQRECPELCGNGTIDTCASPGGGDRSAPSVEECDGANLNAASCTSLGFSRGTLSCGACTLGVTTCDACVDDTRVLACRTADVDVRLPLETTFDIALATTSGEIAVAWIDEPSATGRSGLHLARFRSDLTLIATREIEGPCMGRMIDLAPTPKGFVIAVEAPDGVFVAALDPNGARMGAPRTIPKGLRPVLAARQVGGVPSGGPLLSWGDPTGQKTSFTMARHFAVLRDDATEEAPSVRAFEEAVYVDLASATFVGDGFLLAAHVGPYPDAGHVAVARVELDGRMGATALPTADVATTPSLAWTGSAVRLDYVHHYDSGIDRPYSLALDKNGQAQGSPVELDPTGQGLTRPRIVPLGDATVTLTGHGMKDDFRFSDLQIIRVSPGGTADPPIVVAKAPLIAQAKATAFGSDLVVAWIARYSGSARIGLTRVRP